MYQKIQNFVRLIKSRLGILILLEQFQLFCPVCGIARPANRFPVEAVSLIQRNGSQQDGGKLPGVRVVGAADAPDRLPIPNLLLIDPITPYIF